MAEAVWAQQEASKEGGEEASEPAGKEAFVPRRGEEARAVVERRLSLEQQPLQRRKPIRSQSVDAVEDAKVARHRRLHQRRRRPASVPARVERAPLPRQPRSGGFGPGGGVHHACMHERGAGRGNTKGQEGRSEGPQVTGGEIMRA